MFKDKQDEAQRHAQRDALISMVFRTIVHDFNKSCEDAYILIGRIWGLGERQIQKILKRSDESALGAYDLAEFVVILQRISKESDKSILRSRSLEFSKESDKRKV